MIQGVIDFEKAIHDRENNPDSEAMLKENLQHFAGQRALLYSLLLKGVRLNSAMASQVYNIIHLPSAIRDVRRGLNLSESKYRIVWGWMKDENGKQTRLKEWWLEKD